MKKWLSYRERGVLGRALRPAEVQQFTDTARGIAGEGGVINPISQWAGRNRTNLAE